MKKNGLLSILLVFAVIALSGCSGNAWQKGSDKSVMTYHAEDSRDPILKEVSSVDYRWKISDKNDSTAAATLEFTVHEGKNRYKASASGAITENVLPSGKILWEGPLDGTISMNGNQIPLICSFVKLGSENKVQVSVTFPSSVTGGSALPLFMSFGEAVITEEIHQELQQMQQGHPLP